MLERVPHVTLKSIANNAEIDLIHEKWQPALNKARAALNAALGTAHEEWQVPATLPEAASAAARTAQAAFQKARRERQAEMDASIARNADIEYLHDRPYPKKATVRVTGPFTVESLSPHRVLPAAEEDDAMLAALAANPARRCRPPSPAPAGRPGRARRGRFRHRRAGQPAKGRRSEHQEERAVDLHDDPPLARRPLGLGRSDVQRKPARQSARPS